MWALDLDDLVGLARDEVTRSLTDDECREYLAVDTCEEVVRVTLRARERFATGPRPGRPGCDST